MAGTKLLPCPFCGGEAKAYVRDYGDTHYWRVSCSSDRCGVNPVTNVYHSEAGAIAAWNTRAQTVFGMTLDEVRQMMEREAERERTSIPATEENMARYGWVRERTCHIEHPYYGDAPVINGQPRCSECKTEFAVGTFPNYCPNCGCKVVSDAYE